MAQLLAAEVADGEFIGDYQILEVLGRSGWGTTYHALSNTLEKEFAVKTLTLNEALTPEWLDRLEAQTALLTRLVHPNIDSVVSSGRFKSQWYCVKDFVHDGDGVACNLSTFLSRHGGKLSPYQTYHVLRQVCRALQHAHDWVDEYHGGIYHGALWPENVLIAHSVTATSVSVPFEVRVSDFQPYGLFTSSITKACYRQWCSDCRRLAPLVASKSIAAGARALRRSYDYTAPELERGGRPTASGDLYSLGVLTYLMLTGQVPGASATSPSDYSSGITEVWDQLVDCLLESSVDQRLASVAELAAVMEEHRTELMGVPDALAPTPSASDHTTPAAPKKERHSLTPPGMVFIPKGKFLVGSSECGSDALPQHECETGGFYLDRGPVTNGQYARFVSETGYSTEAESGDGAPILIDGEWRVMPGICWKEPTGRPKPDDFELHPVTQVTYADAAAYCEWLGRRLPTEQEWEYAARGGQRDCRYPWGNAESVAHANANGRGTSPVMSFTANGYGLFDMAGNVWEWSDSWYKAYAGNAGNNPHFGEKYRVVRGGCWMHDLSHCMVSYRNANQPGYCYPTVGFRTACDFKGS